MWGWWGREGGLLPRSLAPLPASMARHPKLSDCSGPGGGVQHAPHCCRCQALQRSPAPSACGARHAPHKPGAPTRPPARPPAQRPPHQHPDRAAPPEVLQWVPDAHHHAADAGLDQRIHGRVIAVAVAGLQVQIGDAAACRLSRCQRHLHLRRRGALRPLARAGQHVAPGVHQHACCVGVGLGAADGAAGQLRGLCQAGGIRTCASTVGARAIASSRMDVPDCGRAITRPGRRNAVLGTQ
jgi:hypothetical protein